MEIQFQTRICYFKSHPSIKLASKGVHPIEMDKFYIAISFSVFFVQSIGESQHEI